MVNVKTTSGGTQYSLTLQLLALMTALTLLPSLLLMMTSFVRIIVVLSLLRQALGTGQTPPNTVLVGLALFLSLFIMSPVLTSVYQDAAVPYMDNKISAQQALAAAEKPIRGFMLAQTREEDLATFLEISRKREVASPAEVPLTTLVPAFIISELKSAFTIGFLIYIPFVVIDLIVSSVLMSMGMMMLSPMMISMPFKLMLFVLVDGWGLIMGSLAASFAMPSRHIKPVLDQRPFKTSSNSRAKDLKDPHQYGYRHRDRVGPPGLVDDCPRFGASIGGGLGGRCDRGYLSGCDVDQRNDSELHPQGGGHGCCTCRGRLMADRHHGGLLAQHFCAHSRPVPLSRHPGTRNTVTWTSWPRTSSIGSTPLCGRCCASRPCC
jgi:flagellar biosynthetic protein FliP